MRRSVYDALRLLLSIGVIAACAMTLVNNSGRVVLFAQSLPYAATFTWTPNPASENVTSYSAQLDSGALVVVLPATCTATVCSAPLSIPSYGPHTAKVFATNVSISGTGTTGVPQNGPTSSLNLVLNPAPAAPPGLGIR